MIFYQKQILHRLSCCELEIKVIYTFELIEMLAIKQHLYPLAT